MAKDETIKAIPAGPEKESWWYFQLKEKQETPKRMEDAAKFLATMISVSLTVFLASAGKDGLSASGIPISTSISLVLWFLSLIFAFLVLFPFRYRFAKDSVDSYCEAHAKIVRVKRGMLFCSVLFFFMALLMLGVVFLFK